MNDNNPPQDKTPKEDKSKELGCMGIFLFVTAGLGLAVVAANIDKNEYPIPRTIITPGMPVF